MMLLTSLFALLIGLSLGVFGAGGSLLTVALFIYQDIGAQAAIGTSLVVVACTAAAALVQYARAGQVCWRTGLMFGATGMVGAYIGGYGAGFVPAVLLLSLLAVVMTAGAVMMLRAPCAVRAARAPGTAKLLLSALPVGALTGLAGAGGGFLVVPVLTMLNGMELRAAIGTSLLVILLNSLAGLAGHSAHIEIDYTLALTVTLFAIAGTFMGHALSRHLYPERLKKGFAWFILAVAAWLAYQQAPVLWKAYIMGDFPGVSVAG